MAIYTDDNTSRVNVVQALQTALNDLILIDDVTVLDNNDQPRVRFRGQLIAQDQEEQFEKVVQRFGELGYTPLLTEETQV